MKVVAIMAATVLALGIAAQDEKPQTDKVGELIKKLGHEEYVVREEAQKELEKMGDAIRPRLEQALEKESDPEVKTRLKAILGNKTGKTVVKKAEKAKPEDKVKQLKELADKLTKALSDDTKSADEKVKEAEKLVRELSKVTGKKAMDLPPGNRVRIVINGKEYKFGDEDDGELDKFWEDQQKRMKDLDKFFEDFNKRMKEMFKKFDWRRDEDDEEDF